MKKRYIGILLAAALVAAQPVSVLAATSIAGGSSVSGTAGSSRGDDDRNVTSTSSSSSSQTTSESARAAASNGFATGGSSGAETTTVGSKKLGFATGEAATAGLPESVVSTINAINAGQELSSVVSGVDVSGCAALTETRALVVTDAATNAASTGGVQVQLYVANLVEGLQNVQILFYDNATNTWSVITPTSIDFGTKQLSFNVNGSGTYSVIYKR